MSIAEIPQLQNLTDEEKIQIMDELRDSLSHGEDDVSGELDRLLAERIAHADAHPESMLTLEEFKRRWAEMKR